MEKGIAKSAWNLYYGGFSIQVIAKNLKLTVQQVEEYIKEWELPNPNHSNTLIISFTSSSFSK